MVNGITSIEFVNDLGSTPARVNRITGEAYLNAQMWPNLTFEQRVFILLHEHAHAELNTTSEFEADARAFELYTQNGLSLKAAVGALSQVLPFSNKEQLQRLYAQYNRARLYDLHHNGNQAAKTDLIFKNTYMNRLISSSFAGEPLDDFEGEEEYDGTESIFGRGKRAQENKEKKNDRKIKKRVAVTTAKGEARANVASKGGGTAGLGAALGSVLNGAKSLLGGKSEVSEEMDPSGGGEAAAQGSAQNPAKNKTLMYVGIGIAVLVVVFLLMRKK